MKTGQGPSKVDAKPVAIAEEVGLRCSGFGGHLAGSGRRGLCPIAQRVIDLLASPGRSMTEGRSRGYLGAN